MFPRLLAVWEVDVQAVEKGPQEQGLYGMLPLSEDGGTTVSTAVYCIWEGTV